MVLARMLPAALAAVSLVACGGGKGQDAETATVDSAARAADSAAKAAASGKLRVANVMIGKRLGSENRIAEPTFQFGPEDTVFISMAVQGAPADGDLAARWLAQNGKVLDSTSQKVHAGEAGNKEFHLAQDKGWKPGTYLITLYLNGDSADSKTFAVRKPQ
jgi:hypothetical protein